MTRKYFMRGYNIKEDAGILEIELENRNSRLIYGSVYEEKVNWIGNSISFTSRYCYYIANNVLYREDLDLLDFGIYPPEELKVNEDPGHFEKIMEW